MGGQGGQRHGNVEQWLREVITWHQLVEWYQFYQSNPFGEDRADLRNAMAGCAIVNEIRTIAAGLSGKRAEPLQVKDLMLDLEGKARRKRGDKRAAQNYYKLWAKSLQQKLELETAKHNLSSETKNRPRTKPRTRKGSH